jgi:hypothetical protein
MYEIESTFSRQTYTYDLYVYKTNLTNIDSQFPNFADAKHTSLQQAQKAADVSLAPPTEISET